jgi:hypothetical protein
MINAEVKHPGKLHCSDNPLLICLFLYLLSYPMQRTSIGDNSLQKSQLSGTILIELKLDFFLLLPYTKMVTGGILYE